MTDIIIGISIVFILSLNAFLLGFFLGRASQQEQGIETIKRNIKRKLNTAPVGAVRRPDAAQLARWKDPKKAAEEDAMIESLKKIPELNKKDGLVS